MMPMIEDFLRTINPILWIVDNVLIVYVAVVLSVFLICYTSFFDPKSTTAGKAIFRFAMALVGVFAIAFIQFFLDPQTGHEWYQYPNDILYWRPIARFFAYSYVAYSVTMLTIVIIQRRWWPDKLVVAPSGELGVRRK